MEEGMSLDTFEFLSDLNTLGIKIWQENNQLRVSAPKGVITPELQREIAARKAEILLFLSGVHISDDISFDLISPTERTGDIPLSMTQQDIWPLIQQHPGSSAYQMATARRLNFSLDLVILENTLAEVARRHEILRTVFPLQDGRPIQMVNAPGKFPIEFHDLQSLPENQRETRLQEQLLMEAARPLDPAIGPLFRIIVFQINHNDFVLLQVLHFLISDCIGQAIIEGEVTRIYNSFTNGEASPLTLMPLQYADFTLWQKNQLNKGKFRAQLDYWRKVLAPPRPTLSVLAGRKLYSAQSTQAIRRSFTLSEELSAGLNALAKRQKGTLYMVLLAAFGIFLSALSDQRKILIGTPVAGRIYPGLEDVVGRFLNTLVLSMDLTGEPSFLALLERTRQTVMDAFSNQDAPFIQVLEALNSASKNETPLDSLFSVQLNFAPLSDKIAQTDTPTFGGEVDLELSDARYPLTLYVSIAGESIRLMFITQEGLFEIAQIDMLLRQLAALLEDIVQDPDRLIQAYFTRYGLTDQDNTPETATPNRLHAHETGLAAGEAAQPEQYTFDAEISDATTRPPAQTKEIEQTLIDLWMRLLKTDQINSQSDFFALGGSSLLALKMVHDVHEAFGVNVPLNIVFRYPRIESIARIIQNQVGKKSWDSLVEIQPNGTKPPIYFVHGITGDTLWFERFVKYLKPDQPIFGLQARGLDGVLMPHESVEDMAQLYIQEIRRHQPTGPYYIGGYSFGGNIAYEIAYQLHQSGQEIGLLIVIDQANPKSDYFTVRLSPSLIGNIFRTLPYRLEDIMRLSPARILKRIGIRVQKAALDFQWAVQKSGKGTRSYRINEVVDYAQSLPEHIQNIIKLGYSALLKYNPPQYPGKLTLIRAKGGRLLCSHDPEMGWGSRVGEVDVRIIPGAHWGLFQEPHIRDLSAMIQTCLDETIG